MDIENLNKKKTNRFRFLRALYEITDGNTGFVSMWELGQELQMSQPEIDGVVNYLNGEGLLRVVAINGFIEISHEGVVEVEEAIEHPDKPTPHFPAGITYNVVNIGTMTDSQFQQGTQSSVQSKEMALLDLDSIRSLVSEFKISVEALGLTTEQRIEVDADLATIEAQLSSPKPKTSILKESLISLRRIAEGTASGVVSATLISHFTALKTFLGM